jgi:DNA-binding GntR family transcriptional regulator
LNDQSKLSSVESLVADAVRTAVMNRRYRPGQKIVQEEVARELGVSRVPVREALRRLEVEGWVSSSHGRGFVVAVASIEDVYETFVIRMALEGVAGREAARSANQEELARAKSVLERMLQVETVQEWLDLNEEFHLTIYRQSHLLRALELIQRYMMISSRWIYSYIGQSLNREKANIQHHEILSAVTEGRSEETERLIVAHLSETCDNATEWLKLLGEILPRKKDQSARG